MIRPNPTRAHSLLELVVATGIFVMVSVALSGVWVMYGRSLAKSGEVMAANSIARSATEGLTANGWEWLESKETTTPTELDFKVKVDRTVRGHKADIYYKVAYLLEFNRAGALFQGSNNFTEDLCRVTVYVRWRSGVAAKAVADSSSDYNNEAVYSAYFYEHGL